MVPKSGIEPVGTEELWIFSFITAVLLKLVKLFFLKLVEKSFPYVFILYNELSSCLFLCLIYRIIYPFMITAIYFAIII